MTDFIHPPTSHFSYELISLMQIRNEILVAGNLLRS